MKETCKIAFTGDIGFDKYMAGKWTDEQLLSAEILSFLNSSDHVVANIEAAMIDVDNSKPHGQFFHAMNPKARQVLSKMTADIWNIGNNHIMDAGEEGLISTKQYAKEMNCATIGAGLNDIDASTPVYLEEAGGIGILGVAFQRECVPATSTAPGVFRWDDMAFIEQRIREIKSRCRWCIVVSHGGEEFASIPNPYTRERYLKYLDMGADVVVGHHPHVPENYEIFENGKMVFYSLGNFIFDTDYQRAHKYSDVGVLVKLILTKDDIRFEALGTQVLRGKGHIVASQLPNIFTDIRAEEYELLAPLGAKAFLEEEKRKMKYWKPQRFLNADKAEWDKYFHSTEPDGYAQGAHMDLSLIVPLAEKAEQRQWEQSKLKQVKEYLTALI